MSDVKSIVSDFLKSGSSSGSGQEEVSDQSNTDDSFVAQAMESSEDSIVPGSEDAPEDSQENQEEGVAKPEATSEKSPGTSAKEVITVTDDQGRRRKVEIDYSDRKAVKQAFEMMHGARKWQAERDTARREKEEVSKAHTEMKSNWDTLEQTFQKSGIEGVIDLLQGQQGAYKAWEKKAVDRAKFMEDASPAEVKALEAQERADREARENDRLRKDFEKLEKKVTEDKDTADLRSLESRVNPVFDRYRFADKLGNDLHEARLDKMLWNDALEALVPYEEKGMLTPEIIEREFRKAAADVRAIIGQQAEKKASRVVEQKKQEATENVQAKVRSGYKSGGVAKEAGDLIQSGNLTQLLKGWGKYGSVFNTKK